MDPKANPVHTGAGAGIAALSEGLLAEILQHVPQQERLTRCALVCKAWAAAAVLATAELEHMATAASMPALNSWLGQHAGQLEGLDLFSYTEDLELQLPLGSLKKLQCLQLDNLALQLLPPAGEAGSDSVEPTTAVIEPLTSSIEDSHAATVAAVALLLPSLQDIVLNEVRLSSLTILLQLAQAAPQLTCLSTRALSFQQPQFCSVAMRNDADATQQVADALPGLLQQLPRLAELQLPGMPLSTAAVQHIAAMQGLQDVWLAHTTDMPVWDLQLLPSSITHLQLDDRRNWLEDGTPCVPSLPPQLQQLTGLLELRLAGCLVPATVLGAFTRLQRLCLMHCRVLPLAAIQGADGWLPEHASESTSWLLDAVRRMPHVESLQLYWEPGAVTRSMAPQQFSALTASSRLTHLTLDPLHCPALPVGAVQHMFPVGRQLPLLQHLSISPSRSPTNWCLDGADITRVCSCCPGLECLSMSQAVCPGTDLSALLQLPQGCTSLSVGGGAFDDAATPVLVQLTQLKQLSWYDSEGFTDAGLEQLAQLDLDNLYVNNCSLTQEAGSSGWLHLRQHSDKGSVSQQLAALCKPGPVCMPALC